MTVIKSVFHGALLTVLMRWSDRMIGMISMIILARLLTPADFGIIAMASIVVGLIDVLLDLGVNIALIQNTAASQEDYDTAWTLRLFQAGFAGLVIFTCAPLAANYYHNPLITDVLRVMAFSVVIAGMENIGIVTFQKNMEFGNDFKFFFYKRATSFLITLISALILHTYWSMVIGALAGRITGLFLSYTMHSHRPRLCLSRLSHLWSFSQWILIRNIGIYMDSRMDKLLLGARSSAAITGVYAVADEISAMPTTELLAPLGRVLFPTFVLKRDGPPEAFAASVITAIGVQALVAIPACIGLTLVASDTVFILLGAQWSQMVPLIQIMSITNLLIAIIHSGAYALLATGHVRLLAMVTWLQVLLFLLTAVVVFPGAQANELAEIRLLVVLTGSLVLLGMMFSKIEALSTVALLKSLFRPLLASGIMAVTLLTIHPLMVNFSPILRLLSEISCGGAIYLISIVIMWLSAGRPEGPEAYLFKNLIHKK